MSVQLFKSIEDFSKSASLVSSEKVTSKTNQNMNAQNFNQKMAQSIKKGASE
jgi:hypothetical protein